MAEMSKCATCGMQPLLVNDQDATRLVRMASTAAVQEFAALVIMLGIGRNPDEWNTLLRRVHQLAGAAGHAPALHQVVPLTAAGVVVGASNGQVELHAKDGGAVLLGIRLDEKHVTTVTEITLPSISVGAIRRWLAGLDDGGA